MHIPTFSTNATAAAALTLLADAGWQLLANGDWSWAYVSPDGATVARVTPWDPAYRLHIDACLRHAGHPHLPRIDAIAPIHGDGYVVFMERLFACDAARGAVFCATLGITNASGDATDLAAISTAVTQASRTPGNAEAQTAASALASLRAILLRLLDEGARTLPFWGGSDIRAGNLMCDTAEQIKVIDPAFLRGRAIVAAIETGDRNLLRRISLQNLEAFLTIPVFPAGAATEQLLWQLRRAY